MRCPTCKQHTPITKGTLLAALTNTKWSMGEAGKLLGITRQHVYKYAKRFGLKRPDGLKVKHSNRAKLVCHRGHPLFGENLRTDAKGWRRCIECDRIAARMRYARKISEQRLEGKPNDRSGTKNVVASQTEFREQTGTVRMAPHDGVSPALLRS